MKRTFIGLLSLAITVSAHAGVLIGGNLLNGNFNDPTTAAKFSQLPSWDNLGTGGDLNSTKAGTDANNYDGTSFAMMGWTPGSKIYANNTGHSITRGDIFDISYVWKDGWLWNDSSDEIKVSLFVTSDNTIGGTRTDLASDLSGVSTANGAYEAVDHDAIYMATAGDAGKTLFVAIETVISGEAYCQLDNFELSVTSGNPDAPSFTTSPIEGATATATAAYSDTIAGEATEPNGDLITYAKTAGSAWLSVAGDGTLSGTPGVSDAGYNSFTITASDKDGTATAQLNIEVLDENGNPIPLASDTEHYRLIWDDDPATKTTVAWKQISGNGTLYYGTHDFGRSYADYPNTHAADRVGNFGNQIYTSFANLTGLQPDTAYYFVIKDDTGVSPRFWFMTAPDTPKPFTFIAGGDSRNQAGTSDSVYRRDGNRLVAKLRPLFVIFTGDFVYSKTSVAEWNQWLSDWEETISSDGRIDPIIPHRGNHEGVSASDSPAFFALWDTTADNYYAFSVGGDLMRFYVLNCEMAEHDARWDAQTDWLNADLTANAANHTHLGAGYHRPISPHNAKKFFQQDEYDAWAQPFYDHGMDVVFEADTHTAKRTWPIKPDTGAPPEDENFSRDDANGTVFSGEGCWGAEIRAANDPKSWTRDLGMFYSFDLVHVYPSHMELYTVKFEGEPDVGALQKGDVFSMPSGINLWAPPNGTRVIINNHAEVPLKPFVQ